MFKKSLIALALVGAVASAQAATITVTSSEAGGFETWLISTTFGNPNNPTPTSSTVTCPVDSCEFLVADDLGNSNPVTEVGLLNTVLNPDVDSAAYSQFGLSDWTDGSFTITGKYFMVKLGDAADVWFQNLLFPTDVGVAVATGNAMGLSHVTTTTTPPPEVPVPGTLGLLGLGLAGLGFVRRRKS